MKLSTGLKWGALVGVVIGLLQGAVGYLGYLTIKEKFTEYLYNVLISQGLPADAARTAVLNAEQWMGVGALLGGVISGVVIYLIVGLVMAALWDRLKMHWTAKGALFSIVLLLITLVPRLFVTPGATAPPSPPPIYDALGAVITFIGPIILAGVLNARGK
nr:hypothetical protein [Pyrobaculum sp.]